MPSKEDPPFLHQAEMEELVAAIQHNLHLKQSRRCSSKRVAPYAAPHCRRPSQQQACKLCALKTADRQTDDPYEILNLLRKGILISEAVKRLKQSDCPPKDKRDFYADEQFCDFASTKNIESV